MVSQEAVAENGRNDEWRNPDWTELVGEKPLFAEELWIVDGVGEKRWKEDAGVG